MLKQTPKKRVLFVRRFAPVALAFFGVFSLIGINLVSSPVATAAASNTINFQARLQSATGAIVSDGNYNVEFNLYTGSSCNPTTGSSCTVEWTEDYTSTSGPGSTDVRLHTVNGYLSASLGSITAFPSTIKWNQQHWISMTVRGTSSCSFSSCTPADSPMLPYMSLTATPYAFASSELDNDATGGRSTLTFAGSGSSHGDQAFVLQDQGAAGTYNILTAPSGSDGYIKLQTTTPGSVQTGNFNIDGTGIANALQAATYDTTTGTSGVLTIGGTNTTSISLTQNVSLAANMSLRIIGGSTRPSSPQDGTLFYDTGTHQLLVYSSSLSKWQADHSTATKIVAMGSPSSCTGTVPVASQSPDGADYIVNSCTSAQTTINSAISALPSGGGTVYLMEGTYIIDDSINLPSNVMLTGAGASTLIEVKDSTNASLNAITNSNTSAGNSRITVSNLRLDGNKANQSSGTMMGINFTKVSSATSTPGAKLQNLSIENFNDDGVHLITSDDTMLSNSTIVGNSGDGVELQSTSVDDTVVGNTFQGNGGTGQIYVNGSGVVNNVVSNNLVIGGTAAGVVVSSTSTNTITNNTITSNTTRGIWITSGNNNTVTGNAISSNSTNGIEVSGSTNEISNNKIHDNGGSGSNDGIKVTGSNNSITSNDITDTAGSGNAINISGSGATSNLLANNRFSGTGATTLADTGTDTLYANQLDSNSNFIIRGTDAVGIGTTSPTSTLTLQGSLLVNQLPAPSAPVVAVTGSSGTTRGYKVTASGGLGETTASAETTGSAASTLDSSTNFVTISWSRVPGAVSYKIYRTTAAGSNGNTTGLICTVAASASTFSCKDSGQSATTAVPAANSTGVIQGALLNVGSSQQFSVTNAGGVTINDTADTSAFLINNAGGAFVKVDTSASKVTIGDATPCTSGRLCVGQSVTGTQTGIINSSNMQTVNVTAATIVTGQLIAIDDDSSPALNSTLNGLKIDFSGSTNLGSGGTPANLFNGITILNPTGTTGNNGNALLVQDGGTNIFKATNGGTFLIHAINGFNGALEVTNVSNKDVFAVSTNSNSAVLGTITSSGSGLAGLLQMADGTTDNFSIGIGTNPTGSGGTTLTANRTLTLDDITGHIMVVQGSSTTQQTGYTNVSGTAEADGGFIGPSLTTANGTTSSAITVQTGNASSGAAGNVTIDTGTTTTGTPTVNLGNANAKAIQIGNNTSNPSISIDSGTGTIGIGTGAQARTINIGTGAAAQALTLGSTNTSSATNIVGGASGSVNISSVGSSTTASTTHIADTSDATGAQAVTIGSKAANTSDITIIQGGSATSSTAAAIQLLPNTAGAITVGASAGTGQITLGQSTATNTISIGDGANTGTQTITIGTGSTGSGKDNVTIGSLNDGSTTTIQGGTGNINLNTNSASASIIAKTSTNSATAFQVQNASAGVILNTDTANGRVSINSTFSAMSAPASPSAGAPTSGGSLTASTQYYYKITAVDGSGGETLPSTEAVAGGVTPTQTSSSNKTIAVSWSAVTGAAGYKIYRGTSTGAEVYLTSVNATSYSDAGAASVGTATVPTTGTAYTSTNTLSSPLELTVGGLGRPTGQVYVSGVVPSAPIGTTTGGSCGSGSCSIATQGSYVYMAGANLQIYNVTDPAAPAQVGTVALSSAATNIAVQGRYAYVIEFSSPASMQIYDISKPSTPTLVSTTSLTNSFGLGIAVSGKYVFVTDNGAIYAYDVSNPASPQLMSTVTTSNSSYSIAVQGRYVYLATQGDNKLRIIDYSNVSAPTVASSTTISSIGYLTVQGRYAYMSVGSNLNVYDVSNPASPASVSSLAMGAAASSMIVQGHYLYMANNPNTYTVDVSNPAKPVLVGTMASQWTSGLIGIQGRYEYASGTTFAVYDLGGTYSQTLESGTLEVSNAQVDQSIIISQNASISGGLNVGSSASFNNDLGVSGNFLLQSGTNAVGALQVKTSSGASLLGVNTSAASVGIGGLTAVGTVTPTLGGSGGSLTGSTIYYYEVTAIDGAGGESAPSPEASLNTGSSNHTITLNWTAVNGAVSYRVYRGTSVSGENVYYTTSTNSYSDTGASSTGGTPPTANNAFAFHVSSSALTFQNTTNSSSAVQIQNAAGTIMFNIDTSTGNITFGSSASGNYITFAASGGFTANGTAQHTKTITLPAEYVGAVLDAAGDSSCSSANNGTMTSGYDGTNFMNYYKWASTTTAQCYDVVVRVPIPSDWAAWSSTTPITISGYTSDTTNGTINLQVLKTSNNTAESSCNYANVTPGSTSTWSSSNSSNCTLASTTTGYSAGSVMTIRIRVSGNASSDTRIGDITLSYKSSF